MEEVQAALPEEDNYVVQTVRNKFEATNTVASNVKKLQTKVETSQSIVRFFSELKQMARHCDYGDREERF